MLLYADDIVIFSDTAEDLQRSLDLLLEYCNRWKLKINVSKTKIMVFRKGGILPRNLSFYYDGSSRNSQAIQIFRSCLYCKWFFCGGSKILYQGKHKKQFFKLNKYLYKFTFISPKHKLDLFDKLISPILNYASEFWGFSQANSIERVHLQFCKNLLGIKRMTQNDFVYGELGGTTFLTRRYYTILKYRFKILTSEKNKYIKI